MYFAFRLRSVVSMRSQWWPPRSGCCTRKRRACRSLKRCPANRSPSRIRLDKRTRARKKTALPLQNSIPQHRSQRLLTRGKLIVEVFDVRYKISIQFPSRVGVGHAKFSGGAGSRGLGGTRREQSPRAGATAVRAVRRGARE